MLDPSVRTGCFVTLWLVFYAGLDIRCKIFYNTHQAVGEEMNMQSKSSYNESRERLMIAAEHLFAEKGYGPITLREIGARAGIHHSSVYHHVPGGKEELFVEVMERILERHRVGLTEALNRAEPSVREQLYAAADWLLSQPPMDLVRMEYVDSSAISPQNAQRLSDTAYMSLQVPLEAVLVEAQRRGEIVDDDFSLVSGGLIGMIESLFAVSEETAGKSRRVMAHRLIDMMLDGLRTGRQEGG